MEKLNNIKLIKCIMVQFLKIGKQYADCSGRTMETGDHSKNGASLKSHTSRRNFLRLPKQNGKILVTVLFAILFVVGFMSCKTEIKAEAKTESLAATVSFDAEGGTKELFSSSHNVEISDTTEWLTITCTKKNDLYKYEAVATKNESKETRTVSINQTYVDNKTSIVVLIIVAQYGKEE
jgi:hypothetical protein